jgi:N-acetylmuramoyl-L-alanine amidase
MMTQATGSYSGGFIIDPGHSPKSKGATSCTGKSEHLYNEILSQYIIAYLSKQHIPVTLTRKPHEELSLKDRALSASGKKIFLSIHHDSVQPQFITWKNTLPTSSKAEGYSIFVSSKNQHYEKLLKYARVLGAALRGKGLNPSKHHGENIAGENRQLLDSENGIYLFDDLVVLKNSDAPAILFEAAVIVNPQDEARAVSESYKRGIAESVAEMMKRIQ